MSSMCHSHYWYWCPAIIAIIFYIWSFLTYLIQFCILGTLDEVSTIIYSILIILIFSLTFGTYIFTMCFKNWYIPEEFHFPRKFYNTLRFSRSMEEEHKLIMWFCRFRGLTVHTRTQRGNMRICTECQLLKPDRTHHCSTCNTCVLKMDHHCPWLNNCIGFQNYKYFLMTTVYTEIYCLYYIFTTLSFVINFFQNIDGNERSGYNIIMAFFGCCILSIFLFILFLYHVRLIFINSTTMEVMYPITFAYSFPVSYNLGYSANFFEICGKNPVYWCCPINTVRGDGVEFEIVRSYY